MIPRSFLLPTCVHTGVPSHCPQDPETTMPTRTSIEAEVPRRLTDAGLTRAAGFSPADAMARPGFLPTSARPVQRRPRGHAPAVRPYHRKRLPRPARQHLDGGGQPFRPGTLKGVESKAQACKGWASPHSGSTLRGGSVLNWRLITVMVSNYYDIDPRFGTRQDLPRSGGCRPRPGMYVILDVIYNHSGNNWFYRDEETGEPAVDSPRIPLLATLSGAAAFRRMAASRTRLRPTMACGRSNYRISTGTRASSIEDWGLASWEDPMSPDVQFRRGDFFDLKKLGPGKIRT
ncbi:MAG: alpha-amylase family glycosyl hydrolase [Anaerolineae bacterium]